MEDAPAERALHTTFHRYEEFSSLQTVLLETCRGIRHEPEIDPVINRLYYILSGYQEQAYLLDPFLEELVTPVVEQFKILIANPVSEENSKKISYLAIHLYNFTNFRGYKAITRFFPHEIADLSIVLNFLLSPDSPAKVQWQWRLRYVVLLWLSLICILPFDLTQFDEPESLGKTAADIEEAAKQHLDNAGVEREGAAVLLARLYARKDANAKLPAFLQWTVDVVGKPAEVFLSIGAMQVLSELAKSAPTHQFQPYSSDILRIVDAVSANQILTSNTLVRKLRIKLSSRVLLRLSPARRKDTRSRGKALRPAHGGGLSVDDVEEDFDAPEELETVLEDIVKALQDKDTVVRYSAAKAVARISERLPSEFAEQVLDTVLQLFTIHSMSAATLYDMPAIAESTWQGACLASAEMARRGLIPDARLGELIDWMRKALHFDIRKGAHSVGASVRDAASYVLWSLARAQSVEALAPFANSLAQTLVTVSICDREVHIRRAASAAFQEFVGRTSLFPHGIDVLRKTDFYAVGNRRNAFLVVAREVAEHDIYRPSLLDHLLTVTIRHWEPVMRRLGAQSIRAVCQLDLWKLGAECIERVTPYLTFADSSDIHGALLTLTELAEAYGLAEPRDLAEVKLQEIYPLLNKVPHRLVLSHRNELVTAAACHFIAHSITPSEIKLEDRSTVPHWRAIIDFALKSSSVVVQEAAADAMAAVSRLTDCSPAFQQSVCRMLGVLDYNTYPLGLPSTVDFLLASVDRAAPTALQNVEARRNAYNAQAQILTDVLPRLEQIIPPETVRAMYDSFLAGLEDYSIDERGDVGSWVRIACVKGITDFATALLPNTAIILRLAEYLPVNKFHEGVAGILKQGVERLDNVRQQAGEQVQRLLALNARAPREWHIHGEQLMRELFVSDENIEWNEGAWLFPRVVKLLAIQPYRQAILAGLVMSAGSKTDSTQRPVSASFVSYARTLPVHDDAAPYDLRRLAADVLERAKRNLASNNIVVPVLQTFSILLDADAFDALGEDSAGLETLRTLLTICSKNVSRFKNVHRIVTSMHVIVNLLPISPLRHTCAAQLPAFLAHQYPKIRSDTAESLYLVLQSKEIGLDTETAEEILLETEWSAENMELINEAAGRCVQLLS